MKVFELFAGIGAPRAALKRVGILHQSVGFSEIDKYAIKSYCAIHDESELKNYGDITEIEELPLTDLLFHGSPCQSFSIAGKGLGGDEGSGTNSSLMWETVRLIDKVRPTYVIWENVKGALFKKHRHNFDKYLEQMKAFGYNNYWQVLNTKHYGVPQNRERVFCVSILKTADNGTFSFPKHFDNGVRLKHLLETNVAEKYYISDAKCAKLLQQLSGTIPNQEFSYCIDANYYKGTTIEGFVNKKRRQLVGIDYTCNNPQPRDTSNCISAKTDRGISNRKQEGTGVLECVPCLTPDRIEKQQNGRRFKEDGEPMFSLTTQDKHGVLLNEPCCLRAERTEYGKEIRKQYESGEIDEKIGNMRTLQPRFDGISNTLTSVQKDNMLLEPLAESVENWGGSGKREQQERLHGGLPRRLNKLGTDKQYHA